MRWARLPWTAVGVSALISGLACTATLRAQETPAAPRAAATETKEPDKKPSRLRDPVDGAFDVSGFLDTAYGFVPIAMPITEPAVGYGAGIGLVFIDKPKSESGEFARPNISAVGGFGTENGTKGGFAVDSRYWLDGKLQTLVGGISASVNLDYYGQAESGPLREHPLRYNLKPKGGGLIAKTQLGQSRYFAGLGYGFAKVDVSFTAPPSTPGLPSFDRQTNIAALMPSIAYDTRDNIFTPTSGWFAEASATLASDSIGSDHDFQKLNLLTIYYATLQEKLTLGMRLDAKTTSGDVPFYLLPSITLRGVPALSYLGDDMAQFEAELRWQCWGRWSAVGFGGVGAVWSDSGASRREKTVGTIGAGVRYEIARKYGLHMGLDVAFGPDDPAIYIQFGSAWMRP